MSIVVVGHRCTARARKGCLHDTADHTPAEDGEAGCGAGHLMPIRGRLQTGGGWRSSSTCAARPGCPHSTSHKFEDEFFYDHEGEANFVLDGKPIVGRPGTFLFLPRDIEHGFEVVGTTTCRMLVAAHPERLENFSLRWVNRPAVARRPRRRRRTWARCRVDEQSGMLPPAASAERWRVRPRSPGERRQRCGRDR